MNRKQLENIYTDNPFMSLNDITYDLLLQEIINYRLPPEKRISESSVADELSISRSPVKSALEKLVLKGYVRVQNNRYFVASFSKKEYKDVTDMSILLESYAAGEAALRLKPEQFDELYKMAYELQRLYRLAINSGTNKGYRELLDMEFDFHTFIVKAAGNSMLLEIYNEQKYKLFRYRSYLLYNPPPSVYEQLENDHIILCDALKLGDKGVASAAAKRHLSISRMTIARSNILKLSSTTK